MTTMLVSLINVLLVGSRRGRSLGVRGPALLIVALIAGACEVPQFEGPQVQSPPEGFFNKSDVNQLGPRTFPQRPSIHFDAWVESAWGEFTGIYINGHEGTTTLEEVVAARAWSMDHPPDHPMDYGDIETLEVDGREAWGWMEIWRDEGLHEIRYHLAVPYDTITYAIDFTTGDPKFKSRPDSIRAIVASFAVGRIEWNWPLVMISAALTALLLKSVWRKISRTPYEDLRHIPLVKIPVPESLDAAEKASPGSGGVQPVQPVRDPNAGTPGQSS